MDLACPTLTVSLDAIAANWRLLRDRHASKHSAAVVKADAYGLGMQPVAQRLAEEGCSTFFVATLAEGLALRRFFRHCDPARSDGEAIQKQKKWIASSPLFPLAQAKADRSCKAAPRNDEAWPEIFIFEGYLRGHETAYTEHRLSPVLNTLEQVARAQEHGLLASAALHVDTGMGRLGLNVEDAEKAAGIPVRLLMTHLACASTPEHPLNAQQWRLFERVRQHFPGISCSMANSAGLFLDAAFHYDLARPGCSLYGITPNPDLPNPMAQVAELSAPILQLRTAGRDQSVGYGATAVVKAGARILTAGIGYADGLHRIAGNMVSLAPNGADRSQNGINAFIGDYALPLLGRVSMDLTCWDASAVPQQVLEKAASISLINATQPVDKVAEICHTIGYEIFTRLGNRIQRVYT